MIGIYRITSPSGNMYIGQSTNLDFRFNTYRLSPSRGQKLIYASIKKYGFKDHKFEIFETIPVGFDKDYLDEWEKLYIWKYQTNRARYKNGIGLNLTDGGAGVGGYEFSEKHRNEVGKRFKGRVSPMKGKKHSEESLKRMSKAQKGKVVSQEARKRMSNSHIGMKNSEETRRKISISNKGKAGVIHSNKEILQIELSGKVICKYTSIKEASRATNICSNNISYCAKNKRKTAGGFIWKYNLN